ncbi:MAG: M48 family metallopeptidase [Burkholderiaceae bacterium]|nr:M48 family metallopeptidase [Burkholderiaceae bacterium]
MAARANTALSRRRWLQWGCAHCAALGGAAAYAQGDWVAPPRHTRPDLAGDEGGLWALMDREETKLRRSSFLVRDPTLRNYLSSLACKLAGEHCPDVRVYPVRTPLFNASMAPNGMMQVWTGLLLRVENEAQLAAVLGHEIGHYLQRHSIERLRDAQARSAFATLLAPFGIVGLVGQLGALAGLLAYSREHEREADRIGIALMTKAGHDPREAAKVWANIRDELSAGPAGDPAKRSVMFATHPGIEERQVLLEQMAADKSGFVGESEYQAIVEPMLWDLCEDELKRAQYDESIVLLDRHCEKRPRRGDLRWFRGEARRLRAQGDDIERAVADFNAALTLDKPPAQAHRSLGFIQREQGRKEDAAASFSRYLEALPAAPDAGLVQSYLSELKT